MTTELEIGLYIFMLAAFLGYHLISRVPPLLHTPLMSEADLVLVVGANDVTNPAAKHDRKSTLYGMPILDVDRARAIIVLKRSMRPGFAGVENELYYDPKCMMLFGDAKESLTQFLTLFK